MCDDREMSVTVLVGEVIRKSSVITLTEGVHVDAHDASNRHYVASRREWSRDYASEIRGKTRSIFAAVGVGR
jgi:hypothetical protein